MLLVSFAKRAPGLLAQWSAFLRLRSDPLRRRISMNPSIDGIARDQDGSTDPKRLEVAALHFLPDERLA
jgi:hypothetical protein